MLHTRAADSVRVAGSTVLATIAFSTALHLSLPFIYLPALLCILAHARRKPLVSQLTVRIHPTRN